ncbi:hypothetical protein PoB_002342100 [Plakobranchus ocellatus]|uniref:Uncharacterized protein n=1 Tax=Plakobranchus ocellatus TaxID=259542 RepID=A0AAV3ZLS8_9GAST|nr:hypothetical protein PoB_002342100 [Plakobranchus ocellatus]
MSAEHTGHALTRKDQWLRIRQKPEQQHMNGNNRISSKRSYQTAVSTRTATTGSAAIGRITQYARVETLIKPCDSSGRYAQPAA